MLILFHEFAVCFELAFAVTGHAVLIKEAFAAGSDFAIFDHGFESGGDVFAVVSYGDISS
jgi:hypothetical protein